LPGGCISVKYSTLVGHGLDQSLPGMGVGNDHRTRKDVLSHVQGL
jgi:hypothetical protein